MHAQTPMHTCIPEPKHTPMHSSTIENLLVWEKEEEQIQDQVSSLLSVAVYP